MVFYQFLTELWTQPVVIQSSDHEFNLSRRNSKRPGPNARSFAANTGSILLSSEFGRQLLDLCTGRSKRFFRAVSAHIQAFCKDEMQIFQAYKIEETL